MLALWHRNQQDARTGRQSRTWLALGTLLWLVSYSVASAATFTASLDQDTITVGEAATLSFSFEGGTPDAVPHPPGNPNMQVTGTGTSTQFEFRNGQSSSTMTYTFRLTPRAAGEYTVPALAATINGERVTSQPLTLKVVQPSAPSPQAMNSGTELAFLKLVLPRKEVFVGETFTAQLQLFLLNRVQGMSQVQGVSQVQVTSFPADGFNVGKLVEAQQRQVQVGNSVYTVIPVEVTLKPIKAGQLTIGPVTFSLVVELPSSGRQRDPLEIFGFSHGEQRQISVATTTETVQSLNLPRENVPADFNGAIGRFTMSMTAGPTNLAAGDPITVKVQITGRGSLDSLNLPDQPAWHDFKTYPPTTKIETADPHGLQGTKTFEQVVTPQSADIKALPPMSFSFFDPDAKTYRTLTQPAIPLNVHPGGPVVAPTVVGGNEKQDNAPTSQDIVPNKQRLGALGQVAPPLAVQPWFLGLQAIPLLALVWAAAARRRSETLAGNPRLRRQRQVAVVLERGLKDLRKAATSNASDAFFTILVRLLQEQLGERLNVPSTSITEAVIDERLRPRGVPETVLNPLHELFQLSNLAKYAPIKSSQELNALIPKLEGLLIELKKLKL